MLTDELKNLLRSRKLKATSARLNLLQEMDSYENAMPYSAMQEALQDIDRVTLYRTLESLKEKGVIHKAYQEGNDVYYALCGSSCKSNHHNHNHIHFKCIKCETVTCETPRNPIDIDLPGVDLHRLNIHAEGICQECLT